MTDKLGRHGKRNVTKNKLVLRCSVSEYKTFDTKITVDLSQRKLPSFFVHLSRNEHVMQLIADENRKLKETLRVVQPGENVDGNESPSGRKESEFMAALIELEKIKMTKGHTTYDKSMKELSLFIFLRGGRSLYETLISYFKFPLPSIATILRYLYDKKPPREGELSIESFVKFNKGNDETVYVWASEDDTRLVEGLTYNSLSDTIVGLCLPTDEDTGCPKVDFFKFISIDAVKYYVREFAPANFAKILVLRPLSKGSKPFILAVYGTRGSDNFEMTMKRWEHVKISLAAYNVQVVGKSNLISIC